MGNLRIEIEIPPEFERDFASDRFKEFFTRAIADMDCVCGEYEKEIAAMFIKSFNNAKILN